MNIDIENGWVPADALFLNENAPVPNVESGEMLVKVEVGKIHLNFR